MLNLIDCTFRDGGYYNNWDFSREIIADYLLAMEAAGVNYVELGFRSFDKTGGFRGACLYTTDGFIRSLNVPERLGIGVMVNASELLNHPDGVLAAVRLMFEIAKNSPVDLVRLACHVHEFEASLPVCALLKEMGYMVGINLMQVADRTESEIESIAALANNYPLDVLYFADSLGGMNPEQTTRIVQALRRHWHGALGIHTHDNMGRAIANTSRAVEDGVTWVDSTVTGMGRGPGNAQTEYALVEFEKRLNRKINLIPLLALIRKHFQPMKDHYGWGINTYYYLAGKYGIHPTYIQEMLSDSRYTEDDIFAVIEYLKDEGGKKFSLNALESARNFYQGEPRGQWSPAEMIEGRDVLILGAGDGVRDHHLALEEFVRREKPFVIGLNTQRSLDEALINIRAACHPVRLLADCAEHGRLPHPLAIPASMLPAHILEETGQKVLLDFGLSVKPNTFEFHDQYAILPSSLVIAYALAIATSGAASRILLAGFDGYAADDPRSAEMDAIFAAYTATEGALPLLAITPCRYNNVDKTSIYAF